MNDNNAPHQNQPLFQGGLPLTDAAAAMILIHGRGATAADILSLTHYFHRPEFAYLAPQAADYSWYPFSFLAPIEDNQPGIDSGLGVIAGLLETLAGAGIPAEKTVLLGFSQGACLALEFAARHPARYGGVVGLSGGFIGPPSTTWERPGSLAGTPVFLGCSDVDPHIPKSRVQETAAALTGMGAEVTERLYPGMGHLVNEDELAAVGEIMAGLL